MFNKKNIGQLKKVWRKIRFFVIAAAILSAAAVLFFAKEQEPPNEALVVYDGKSFKPEKVTIGKGGKVVFRNEDRKNFWPASDFHPTNGVYPEFDPKKPVPAGGAWEFTFDRAGEWGYHDHLAAFHKGTVVVMDKSGKPAPDSCSDLEDVDYQSREVCWYRQIKKEIGKNGVPGAFKLFTKIYNSEPLFGQGCHDVMHLIGDEAYREYRKGIKFTPTIESTYCGYGFYHGFIEAMLYTSGDYEEVRNFCESLSGSFEGDIESSNAIYSCYHGIGHSTFDIHDSSLWGDERKMVYPAIATCEKATAGLEEEKTKQCVTGVFNALGNAYSNDQYYLKMDPKDPVWICREQKDLYKKGCYIDVAFAWIAKYMGGGLTYNFDEAVKFIASLGDPEGEKAAMKSSATDYTRLKISEFNPDFMIGKCRSVKDSLYESCLQGIVEGLLSSGKPEEEYKAVISFCNSHLFGSKEKGVCYAHFLPFLSTIYSKEKRLRICSEEVPEVYKNFCNQP